jgi:hypothetical protein
MILSKLYSAIENNKIDDAIDIIIDAIDDRFRAGRFEEVDDILLALDLSRLETSTFFAIVVLTKPAKEKLKNRSLVLDNIKKYLTKEEIELDFEGLF